MWYVVCAGDGSQGATCYTSYTSLFVSSNAGGVCPYFAGTSVSEIASYGIPMSSIIVGKPLLISDAGSGYVSPTALRDMMNTASGSGGIGWPASVMFWSWDAVEGPAWLTTLALSYGGSGTAGTVSVSPSVTPSAGTLSVSRSPSASPSVSPSVAPSPVVVSGGDPGTRILNYLHARGEALSITTPSAIKTVYIDWRGVDWNDPTTNVKAMVDAGFNVIILAFYMTSGPVDVVQAWAGLSSTKRASSVAYAHSKGAIVLMAVGGSTGACVCCHMCICVFVCDMPTRWLGCGRHAHIRACMHAHVHVYE